MRLEHYNQKIFTQEILAIIGKHLDLSCTAVFFFGSRVSEKGSDTSDIDIGIQGDAGVPRQAMRKIKNEIGALSILYKIDVVDFFDVSPNFREVALQHVEYVTDKKI